MPSSRWVSLLVLILTLTACEHGDPLTGGQDEGLQPTLDSIQEHIFSTTCALSNCHIGPNAQLGLDLSEGNARQSLVEVPSARVPDLLRVEPGNAADSYLILKLEGDARIVGSRMPLGGTPLSMEEIEVVRAWIDGGAD